MKKIRFVAIAAILAVAVTSCASAPSDVAKTKPQTDISSNETVRQSDLQKKKRYDGAGIVIAVPVPQIKSEQKTDKWIGQFVQDSITTNLARYSKMTVLDRANEQLTIAEQSLSESGYYSEENTAELGHMTNAQYVLAGSIQNVSGIYAVNFRVNDITTNEIKSSYANRYTLKQIESGFAVQEISREIITGLGIDLDEKSLAELSSIDNKTVSANQNLAKGAAAESEEDYLSAILFFSKAEEVDPEKRESTLAINNMLGASFSTKSIKERFEFDKAQIAKWNKIFEDLENFRNSAEVPLVVYDFSRLDHKTYFNSDSATVDFDINPGIKVFPDRKALLVDKTICDSWEKIRENKENDDWSKKVNCNIDYSFSYAIEVCLYDSYGDPIAKTAYGDYGDFQYYFNNNNSWAFRNGDKNQISEYVVAQQKYYETAPFQNISFWNIKGDSITDTVTPKIGKIKVHDKEILPRIFSVEEYEAFVASGCNN